MVRLIGKLDDQLLEYKMKCLITKTLAISLIVKSNVNCLTTKFMILMEFSNIPDNQETL